ncbi:pyruvate transporter mpc1 [Pichia californica]|uniref:Mitochondrial pyruvate carrier n=1 Tax=Pichia californica TaxID=460514 RepID=A0A9P6WMZ7_9ASCO|nr:pyruvate transporter mpc1 [[Candida] californica]KAG0690114.1 pyruvate transporter mpc1 [[Candida] californica]
MSSKITHAASQSFAQKFLNKETFKYIFTTHFWGPVSNFGIPIAAVLDIKNKPADTISGPMTAALIVYSAVFMRFSVAVTPKNYLLFGCHLINEFAQVSQGFRYVNYHYLTDNSNSTKK